MRVYVQGSGSFGKLPHTSLKASITAALSEPVTGMYKEYFSLQHQIHQEFDFDLSLLIHYTVKKCRLRKCL